MRRLKTFLSIFLALLPMMVNAQYYSGNVGDWINLDDPTPPVGWQKVDADYYPYNCPHLDVSKSRVKIMSYFTGKETVKCDLYCVRQYTIAGRVYDEYKTYTYTFYISCSSNPDTNPGSDNNPGSSNDEDDATIYHTKTIEGVDITLVKYDGATINGSQYLCADGYYYSSMTPCVKKSTSGTVTIPSSYNGYDIKEISRYAFYECANIDKVVIPNTVSTVGYESFLYCGLNEIVFGNSVKGIGGRAFYFCENLKKIELPSSVENVISFAFCGCKNVESITIPENIKLMGFNAFCCFNVKKITCLRKEPLTLKEDPFDSNDIYNNAVLYVPQGSKEKYQSAKYWSKFKTIKEIGDDKVLVTSISLNSSSSTLTVGDTKQLTATVYPSDATDKSVSWESNDTTVATVSTSGLVTAKSAGSATITCWANDGSGKSATCSITVESGKVEPTSISLPYSISVKVKEQKKISYTLNPSNATTSITWKSDDTSIATVSSTGYVTGVKAGTTKVRATTSNGKTDYCNVTVEENTIEPTSISLPSSKTVKVGESFTMSYTLNPSNATTTLTWTSDDKTIATVSSSGVVTGVKAGSTYINVKTANGKTDYCRVTVESAQNGITDVSFVSLTCDNTNLCKLKNSDVIKAHLTIKNTGETGVIQTRIRTYDDNDENSKYWHSSSELSKITFSANETKTIDFDVPLKDANKGSYYLALNYFDDKNQEWYYNGNSIKKIAIVDDFELEGDGSRNNPYNSVAANAYAASLKPDEKTTNDIYVKGIVSSVINDYSDGTVTLYISEDGNDNNRFHVRYSYYKWDYYSSGKLPQKGDEILVKGNLRYYKGNIPEAYYAYVLPSSDASIFDSKVVTLSDNGYATFYSSESAYTLPYGLSAQVVTGCNNNKLTYKTIADGSVSGVVPKATAVMLVSDNKIAGSFALTPSESTVNYSGNNYLYGSDESTTTTASGSNYYYKLTNGNTGSDYADIFGWYWGAQNGGAFWIEGHKAWLAIPKTMSTRSAFAMDDDATVIDGVSTNRGDDVYYDMQGRRIDIPTAPGLYIINGKKVLINKKK